MFQAPMLGGPVVGEIRVPPASPPRGLAPIMHARSGAPSGARGGLQRGTVALVRIGIALSLLSCRLGTSTVSSPTDARDSGFATAVPYERFNTILRLSPVDSGFGQPNASVNFMLENVSNTAVRFPPGYGSRLFFFSESKGVWVELRNRASYVGAGDTLSPRSEADGNWIAQVTVAPDLSQLTTPLTMRVLVVGDVLADGVVTGDIAAAYADVQIQGQ